MNYSVTLSRYKFRSSCWREQICYYISIKVFHHLLMWLLITISLRRINALKYHLQNEIFMYYKLHLSTFVLGSEGSDYRTS